MTDTDRLRELADNGGYISPPEIRALLSERDRWEEQALDAATRERLRLEKMGELLDRIAELEEGLLRIIGARTNPREIARSLLSEAQPSLSSSGVTE